MGFGAYSTSMISRCSVLPGARRFTWSPGLAFISAVARRAPTDVAAVEVHFVDAYDRDDVLEAGGVLVGEDGGAEEDARGGWPWPRSGRLRQCVSSPRKRIRESISA